MDHPVVETAKRMLGLPYIWGGNSHLTGGVDCSGLALESLRSAGEGPPGDATAQGIFDWFSGGKASWNAYKPGALIFFGESASKITHVAVLINSHVMIEAAGGDSTTTSVEEAIRRNAFVRMRPISDRKEPFRAVLRPYYRKIGEV